ncbi:MAG: 4Fe-4S binding protein [Deltaproteobacteria bacterium]|uniref:4Fe-4S binding protein n=1 Tax=Candidatus Desulfacyla euxinica TaxID=2841693 RepID=A0A8J6N0A0_9DELT|nr:4Fe-4S binding protein [Candidatus Desulfacyla euxinica]
MAVVVHEDKCKGCKLCVAACSYAAISIQEKKAVLNAGCTNCGACIDSCEFDAISFEGSEERIRMDVASFEGIYIFIEQDNQTASKVSLELLGKARGLADEFLKQGKNQIVTAILIGYELGSIADELIYYGADHVIIMKDEPFRMYQTDIYTKAIVQIAREKKPEILLFGATPLGRDLAPRVANRLRTGLTADCTALEICTKEGILLQTRPAFGGNIMATIVCPDNRPQMATVRPGVMKKSLRDPERTGTKEMMNMDLDEKDFITRILDIVASTQKHVKLEDAKIIVAGGHGVNNPEGFEILEALAAELGAEVGASRAAVDAGWIGQDHQIGQTGKTVQPDLYIACGISGSIQHLAGMSQSKYIISINNDRKSPIVSASDVTFIGDLFQVVPMLTDKIREYKEKNGLNPIP